jgi:hypothetical protein
MVFRRVLSNPCLGGGARQQFAREVRLMIGTRMNLNPANLGPTKLAQDPAQQPVLYPRRARGIMMPPNGKMLNIHWPNQGRSPYKMVANLGGSSSHHPGSAAWVILNCRYR